MNADFLDAHHRHMVDAETLFQASRIANADQLYGFAAECGLKKLMSGFGMPLAQDGSPAEKPNWKHVELVWIRYESYRSSAVDGANYVLPNPNPFHDWHASQRYANSGDIARSSVEAHKAAAGDVAALVRKAQLEGLI
ncbi:SAM-dependent methyltransferase [Pseudomonas brassicacearum]|uniref:SAM-dependent methyltransferase n=1 Tax=Pseudomonas brassicacearum TaxID=930166 RepID=A0AAJ3FU35_9PSED|nr:SAM-dependent methyltransferase [Pseudomonas brassicacearum]NUT80709.1 SAM-dependent methyltransferase [Pseudomonas brassicacearum]